MKEVADLIDTNIICWSKMENETVVINLETGFYYSLDELGGWIWDMLSENVPREEIASRIAASYEIDEAAALADLKEFMQELRTEQLIDVREQNRVCL